MPQARVRARIRERARAKDEGADASVGMQGALESHGRESSAMTSGESLPFVPPNRCRAQSQPKITQALRQHPITPHRATPHRTATAQKRLRASVLPRAATAIATENMPVGKTAGLKGGGPRCSGRPRGRASTSLPS